MPKVETYKAARERLLRELQALGWKTSKPGLKIPWAEPVGGAYRLWFRAQAVYKDAHSLFFEIRGRSAATLIAYAEKS